MRASGFAAFPLIWLALASVGTAQEPRDAVARLQVIDAATRRPIGGAKVGFPDLDLFTATDDDGNAILTGVEPGDHAFEVTMLGYGRASAYLHLGPGAVGSGTVELSAKPTEIEGFVVRVRPIFSEWLERRGFYEREKVGLGYHFDEQAFDALRVFTLNQLFRRIPFHDCSGGLAFGLAPAGTPLGFSASGAPSGRTGIKNAGSRKIFVNGVPVRDLVDVFGKGDKPIDVFEAVEVYNGPEVPGPYSGLDTDCGVILLWLK